MFTINLNNTRFSVGDTFALPVTVKDYGRKYTVTTFGHFAYKNLMGRVTVLVCSEFETLCKNLFHTRDKKRQIYHT